MFSVICCWMQSQIKMLPLVLILNQGSRRQNFFCSPLWDLEHLKNWLPMQWKMRSVFTSLSHASHWHFKVRNIWSFKIILSIFELIFFSFIWIPSILSCYMEISRRMWYWFKMIFMVDLHFIYLYFVLCKMEIIAGSY